MFKSISIVVLTIVLCAGNSHSHVRFRRSSTKLFDDTNNSIKGKTEPVHRITVDDSAIDHAYQSVIRMAYMMDFIDDIIEQITNKSSEAEMLSTKANIAYKDALNIELKNAHVKDAVNEARDFASAAGNVVDQIESAREMARDARNAAEAALKSGRQACDNAKDVLKNTKRGDTFDLMEGMEKEAAISEHVNQALSAEHLAQEKKFEVIKILSQVYVLKDVAIHATQAAANAAAAAAAAKKPLHGVGKTAKTMPDDTSDTSESSESSESGSFSIDTSESESSESTKPKPVNPNGSSEPCTDDSVEKETTKRNITKKTTTQPTTEPQTEEPATEDPITEPEITEQPETEPEITEEPTTEPQTDEPTTPQTTNEPTTQTTEPEKSKETSKEVSKNHSGHSHDKKHSQKKSSSNN